MIQPVELDYLVIGHVTRDLVEESFTLGGTVTYCSHTARALGERVGVVTSTNTDLDLSEVFDDILVSRSDSAHTTTFENIYLDGRRRQIVHSHANILTPDMVPTNWQPAVVHVGPIAGECDASLSDAFSDSFLGVTPQGWMRRWDGDGQVSYGEWKDADRWLARADAVVLSDEDVCDDQNLIISYAARTRLLVVTHGIVGYTIYTEGNPHDFEAEDVEQVDPTGAGDIFAATFFIALNRGDDPWTAARFANCVAACSVTRPGLSGVPNTEEIARCQAFLSCAGE
jgi:sugar/nucleoside kinase (ribokinase family)